MSFVISKSDYRQKFQTRGGLEVRYWSFLNRTNKAEYPIRATIVHPDGTTESISYTRSGQRYIDRESVYDLIPAKVSKERKEKLDCMPDVLRAIRCVRNKDMSGVRSANKDNVSYYGASYADDTPVEIGGTL